MGTSVLFEQDTQFMHEIKHASKPYNQTNNNNNNINIRNIQLLHFTACRDNRIISVHLMAVRKLPVLCRATQ